MKISTFPTSTVVQGEYVHAMNCIQKTISDCHKEFKNAVYFDPRGAVFKLPNLGRVPRWGPCANLTRIYKF